MGMTLGPTFFLSRKPERCRQYSRMSNGRVHRTLHNDTSLHQPFVDLVLVFLGEPVAFHHGNTPMIQTYASPVEPTVPDEYVVMVAVKPLDEQ
jgi:hypothetical protein